MRRMAIVGIREYDAKRLLCKYSNGNSNLFAFDGKLMLVTLQTDIERLHIEHPWLLREKLVVKPDQLFGKRGKHELVLLDASLEEVKTFLDKNLGRKAKVGGVEGTLTHFS